MSEIIYLRRGINVTLRELRRISDALGVNPGAIVRGQVFEWRPRPLHETRRAIDVGQKVSKLKTSRERARVRPNKAREGEHSWE